LRSGWHFDKLRNSPLVGFTFTNWLNSAAFRNNKIDTAVFFISWLAEPASWLAVWLSRLAGWLAGWLSRPAG